MKRYYKTENEKVVWFNGILKLDGKQIFNPSEEQLLSEGWKLYKRPEEPVPSEEDMLNQAKEQKIEKLYAYDGSGAVNRCVIVKGGVSMNFWADKHERDALKSAVRDHITLNIPEYRLDLRELGVSLWIPCEDLLGMLAQLEVYATSCYNKTTDHEFAIKALGTVEEVEAYIFRGVGYPEMLTFNF